MNKHVWSTAWAPALLLGALAISCSDGRATYGGAADSEVEVTLRDSTRSSFTLERTSVSSVQVWGLNRPIHFYFSDAVDFNTVNANTITIESYGGTPATGTFYQDPDNDRIVVFQPDCPDVPGSPSAGFIATEGA